MASKKLRRAGVSQELCDLLKRHHVESCKVNKPQASLQSYGVLIKSDVVNPNVSPRQDLLSLTPLEVMRVAGLSYQNALTLMRSVSQHCAPPVTTVQYLFFLRVSVSLGLGLV